MVGEGASSICEIISLLEKIIILVIIEYISGYLKIIRSFKENPAAILISEYDKRAKKLCKEIANGENLSKTGIFGSYAVFYTGSFTDRAISEVVRLIDAETIENEYTEE